MVRLLGLTTRTKSIYFVVVSFYYRYEDSPWVLFLVEFVEEV